jgi:gluconate 2-dehydrogenase gamma chain
VDDPYGVDRRGFLKVGGAAAAAAAVGCRGLESRWRALSDDEAGTLAAVADQIVPPDEDAGAAQAGVVAFIDRQLATRRKKSLAIWRSGIRSLETTARRLHAKGFVELGAEAQAALLRALEQQAVDMSDWPEIGPKEFFHTLRSYTLMGFYGDPRHGGNRNRVAWRMLGIPDPPIRGRLHETPPPAPPGPGAGGSKKG